MTKQRIDINDLSDNAVEQMTEEDIQKVTGGIAIIANQFDLRVNKVQAGYGGGPHILNMAFKTGKLF
jgi:hypothetical protein